MEVYLRFPFQLKKPLKHQTQKTNKSLTQRTSLDSVSTLCNQYVTKSIFASSIPS